MNTDWLTDLIFCANDYNELEKATNFFSGGLNSFISKIRCSPPENKISQSIRFEYGLTTFALFLGALLKLLAWFILNKTPLQILLSAAEVQGVASALRAWRR